MSERLPTTVNDLLPALIELASIQHDLIALDIPPAPGSRRESAYTTANTLGVGGMSKAMARARLLARSREVLSWLLERIPGA